MQLFKPTIARSGLIPALLVSAAFFTTACRDSGSGPGGPGNNNGNTDGGVTNPGGDCPGEGTTVCALKLSSSSRHPAIDDPVALSGVVITTPTMAVSRFMGMTTLAGFYVQDPAGASHLAGRYSGVLVVYTPGELQGTVPPVGEIVNIEGTFAEFGQEGFEKQKQVKAARVDSTGQRAAVEPILISDAALIAAGGPDAAAYDGVLVKIEEVAVTETEVMNNGSEIFGAFRIQNSLVVSGAMYEYRNPQPGEQFTAISGVLRIGTAPFDAGLYLLTPRFSSDVVAKNAAAVVTSIAGIQDPTSPDRPLESCSNPNGNQVVGRCATAQLTRVLVTAAGGYVSRNLRSLFVQDPNDADGKYSGVKVVYNPNTARYVPMIGEYVNITGEIINYRGGVQVQYPEISRNGTDTGTPVAFTVTNTSELSRDSSGTHAYEGALVRLENVTVTERCTEDDQQRDHGYWIVAGNVLIGSAFPYGYNGGIRPSDVMCLTPEQEPTGECSCAAMSRPDDMRVTGDVFTSIVGVVDFAFEEFKVEPRSPADLVKN